MLGRRIPGARRSAVPAARGGGVGILRVGVELRPAGDGEVVSGVDSRAAGAAVAVTGQSAAAGYGEVVFAFVLIFAGNINRRPIVGAVQNVVAHEAQFHIGVAHIQREGHTGIDLYIIERQRNLSAVNFSLDIAAALRDGITAPDIARGVYAPKLIFNGFSFYQIYGNGTRSYVSVGMAQRIHSIRLYRRGYRHYAHEQDAEGERRGVKSEFLHVQPP